MPVPRKGLAKLCQDIGALTEQLAALDVQHARSDDRVEQIGGDVAAILAALVRLDERMGRVAEAQPTWLPCLEHALATVGDAVRALTIDVSELTRAAGRIEVEHVRASERVEAQLGRSFDYLQVATRRFETECQALATGMDAAAQRRTDSLVDALRADHDGPIGAIERVAAMQDVLLARTQSLEQAHQAMAEDVRRTVREVLEQFAAQAPPHPDRSALASRTLSRAAREDCAGLPLLELELCNGIARDCVFVVGFARSSTTIVQNILNTDRRTFMTGEANFYLRNERDFISWYNQMHRQNGTLPTKSTYAPDFGGRNSVRWWEWLAAASQHFHRVGDKLAFNAEHFDIVDPETILRFFEARFYEAKFILLIRDPVQTICSLAMLLKFRDEESYARHCMGWLKFCCLWIDWLKLFPSAMPVLAEDLMAEGALSRIGDFVGTDLSGAAGLLRDTSRHLHDENWPLSLRRHIPELRKVYASIGKAMHEPQGVWQIEDRCAIAGSSCASNALADARQRALVLMRLLEMQKGDATR